LSTDAPGLDIEQVATGEHWYGVQALEKGLVDAVETSDELLLGLMESHEVIVRYQQRKKCSTALPVARRRAPIGCCCAGGSADRNR
jgi:ClpP class serine protease